MAGGRQEARIVWDAAGQGNVFQLIDALTAHGHLIDTPNSDPTVRKMPMPMHHAAQKGNVLAIEILFRFGSKAIDASTKDQGWTPMHLAAENGHVEAIETLVRLGSKALDTPTRQEQCTPLHLAAQHGHLEVVESLLRFNVQSDSTDVDGHTPLHYAVHRGHVSIVEALVRTRREERWYGELSEGSCGHQDSESLHS